MMENLQNSLAISRRYGVADLFITMIANPKWPELLNALLPGQTPTDRLDLVSHVFHQKKVFLIDLIVKKEVFGSTVARVHTIEFQKRGLLHMHLLIWLQREYKFTTPAEVNTIISAEFPDPQTHPRLFRLVSDVITHGPCGDHKPDAPWMQNRCCGKHCPKELCDETIVHNDGYPKYRRWNTGVQHEICGFAMDNRWVIPYSPFLLLKMECHINVELTFNVRSIKYIHKYLYKGHDRTTMELGQNRDEIKQYLDARYVSALEVCWRFLERELYTQKPPVIPLPVHEKDAYSIVFDSNTDEMTILERVQRSKTMLMGK